MSISKRVLAVIVGVFILIIIIVYITSNIFLVGTFKKTEKTYAENNGKELLSIFNDEMDGLNGVAIDYSRWDDSYRFMQHFSREYIESNFSDVASFVTFNVDLIIYASPDGRIAYSSSFNRNNAKPVNIDKKILTSIISHKELLRYDEKLKGIQGLINTSEGPLMIISQPILKTDGKGPSMGSLIIGRYLDKQEIDHIARIMMNNNIKMFAYEKVGKNPELYPNVKELSVNKPILVKNLNSNTTSSYILLNDLEGNGVIVVRIDMSRKLYQYGKDSLNYFIAVLIFACAAFVILCNFLLKKIVVSRLTELSDSTSRISKSGDLSIRMPEEGNDEITSLVRDINGMLNSLEKFHIELEKSRIAAESVNVAKSQFLSNITHEIKTPMNGIIGMTELMSTTNLDEEQREYINTVRESADNLLGIINDILDFTNIDAGELRLAFTEFNLRDTAAKLSGKFSDKAGKKGIEFICSIDEKIPSQIIGDPRVLTKILSKILDNAVKFTNEGRISFNIDLADDNRNKMKIKFSITDTGIGILPDKVSLLFDSFTQVDASTKRRYGGTGIGLAIVKRLVEIMNGEIWVESVLNEGSTFSFVIEFDKENSEYPGLNIDECS